MSKALESRMLRTLKGLRRLDERARTTRDRADRYPYLERVLKVALRWHKKGRHLLAAKLLAEVPPKDGADLSTLIEWLVRNTDEADRRLRWKHSAALKYAAFRGAQPGQLIRFLARNGGLNGCARLWTVVTSAK